MIEITLKTGPMRAEGYEVDLGDWPFVFVVHLGGIACGGALMAIYLRLNFPLVVHSGTDGR